MKTRSLVLSLIAATLVLLGSEARALNVLILTDNSGPFVSGDTHVSDLIAAFTNTGAGITTNTTELTNGSAMPASLLAGWNVVIVVTVCGAQIDADDIPVIQGAVTVNSAQSFLFFTDACDGCMVASANAVLPILNAVGSWSATLGSSDNTYPYTGTLNGSGSYVTAFASLPTIAAGAYSPLVGVPSANVIYDGDATIDGPFSVVAPASNGSSCVFLTTDTTQFWKTGGIITAAQADALALAYLDAAIGVGVPCESVAVTPATWSATKQLYRDSAR